MGVKGLWKLVEPVGRTVSLETLEGKVLAVDMSIWLTQFVKAMRDDEGKLVKNAHLIGTVRRILKLMHFRIRPVFVFDGETPALKLQTMRRRRTLQTQHEGNFKKAAEQILMSQVRLSMQQQRAPPHMLPTFHPHRQPETAAAEAPASSSSAAPGEPCSHWPGAGARVRWVASESGEVSFGNVTDDEALLEQLRADGQLVVILRTGASIAVDFPDPRLELIEPCARCFPLTRASPQEVSSASRRPTKKRKADQQAPTPPQREGRLYDSDSESFGSSSEGSIDEWAVPSSGDLDIETLASLPRHMRRDLIEASRKQERALRRASYLPVADDPALYSQAQVVNFLRSR